MNLNSPWLSAIPLFVFNAYFLVGVLIFRSVYRNRPRTKEIEDRAASGILNRWIREYWFWITDPVMKFLIWSKVTPNALTTIGVLMSGVAGYFFWKGYFGLAGWTMIAAANCDLFDGRIARQTGSSTKFGAYYDSVMDRVAEALVYLGICLHYRNHWGLVAAFMGLVGSFMVSYTRARGDASGVSYDGGMMQRPERIVYTAVSAVFIPMFGWPFQEKYPQIQSQLYLIPLTFVTVMTWVTTRHRILKIKQMMEEKA